MTKLLAKYVLSNIDLNRNEIFTIIFFINNHQIIKNIIDTKISILEIYTKKNAITSDPFGTTVQQFDKSTHLIKQLMALKYFQLKIEA